MKANTKISCAVAAILNASLLGVAHAADPPPDAATISPDQLAQVIVTAQRVAQNLQNVPITMQVLTAKTLSNLNTTTFEDFLQFLPNVSIAPSGPGQDQIIIRGLNNGESGTQAGGTLQAFPNVAVYLDDESEALPSRNLDVYAVDLQRIEVLEGPQGTLFGGGAEAGVIRYITNKPKLDVTEGAAEASYGSTAHGAPNSSANVVLNVPLIPHTLAARGVFYTDRRGGYIDNLPGEFHRMGTDLGLAERNGGVVATGGVVLQPGQVPADSVVINNDLIAGKSINSVTYTGGRLEVLGQVNDDWNVLLAESYQTMDAQGVFYQQAQTDDLTPIPPLSVTLFNPSFDDDQFENTALTVSGKLGDWRVVYSGAYLIRNVDQEYDLTTYARGIWGSYYQCTGYSSSYDPPTKCYTPSATFHEQERNTHVSHELHVMTPEDKRLRAISGVYWEKFQVFDQSDYNYRSVPTCTPTFNTECFLDVAPRPGVIANNPNVRSPDDGFFDDVVRGYKQTALYASVDFDIIPKKLTLTAGTRWFRYDEAETGQDVGSFYCKYYAGQVATNFAPCSPTNYNGFGPGGPYGIILDDSTTAKGFRSRGNLTWHVTDNVMLYYTWSQGFRPGGFNRGSSGHLKDQNGVNQYITPVAFAPDTVTNNEFGWKAELLDGRVLFNGSIYQESWSNVQTGIDDPQGGLGNLAFVTNGPGYRVRGVEPSIQARIAPGLVLATSAAWNSSSQTNSPYLVVNNPESVNYGQSITSIPNPFGPLGSPLPYAPPFKGSLVLRYTWALQDYALFAQVSGVHQAHSFTSTGYVQGYELPSFSTYDASFGVSKDNWHVVFYGQNLTNEKTIVNEGSSFGIVRQSPLRPRVLAIKVGYDFSNR